MPRSWNCATEHPCYETPRVLAARDWPFPDVVDKILSLKKAYYNDWQFFKNATRDAHKEKWGIEAITAMKEQEAFNRRRYRSTTFVLPWFTDNCPGDCKPGHPRDWPIDLADDLDATFGILDAAF